MMEGPAQAVQSRPLDIHVHVVGNGRSGSGCWLRMRGLHRPLARHILKHIQLDIPLDHPEFDQLYAERLAELVRGSSLGAVVLLAHEQVYDENGNLLDLGRGFHVPNDYVFALAQQNPQFLPGVAIHPGRRDALEELERCLARGAVLMKCLPNCQNIDCNHPKYTRFWERMAEAGLPLLAHTGGEHTVPVVNAAYAHPATLTLPLECGVNVIAAHCATGSGLGDPDYFHWFKVMADQFPNLYGDTSALNLPGRSRALGECRRAPLANCLVHGSDYPVPNNGLWAFLRGYISWRAYRRCQAIENPIERDFRLKTFLGFPPDHFTRGWSLLRLTAEKKPGGSVRG